MRAPPSVAVADLLPWAVPTHLVLFIMQYGYAGVHGPDALAPVVPTTFWPDWVKYFDGLIQALAIVNCFEVCTLPAFCALVLWALALLAGVVVGLGRADDVVSLAASRLGFGAGPRAKEAGNAGEVK